VKTTVAFAKVVEREDAQKGLLLLDVGTRYTENEVFDIPQGGDHVTAPSEGKGVGNVHRLAISLSVLISHLGSSIKLEY
jgi:hypothetical protein